MRSYAIGDIHGQLEALRAAHGRIAEDRARSGDDTAPVVHLGDLVDRGPDSAGVIDYLVKGQAGGAPWIVLMGNHDQIFRAVLRAGVGQGDLPDFARAWTSAGMGGLETLSSYGVRPGFLSRPAQIARDAAAAVPPGHRAFLEGLPLFHETEGEIFVHAGLRPGLPLYDQIEEDLLWIRGEFLNDIRDHGRLVVHGHTPVEEPMHCGNRVNLDTGAGFGRPLTAAVIEDGAVFVLTNEGRVPLEAP
ncbi:MAG: metallophosphoesterase family protein [Pseudomonadota bacterium]